MDDHLLKKFFKGQCTEQEKQQILHWYLSGQADNVISDRIEAYWKAENDAKDEWGKSSVLTTLNKKIDKTVRVPVKVINPSHHFRKWGYAAAVIFLVISGVWGLVKYDRTKKIDLVSAAKLEPIPAIIYKQTNRGEKSTVTLDDETVVNLNAGSRIWYSQAFGKNGRREVFLEGEAFFEVARDTLRPFQIHTGSIETTVLGTSFNINAYHPEEAVTVSVVTGKVEVRQAQQAMPPVYLVADEQAEYSVNESTLRKRLFDYQKVLSWKEGTLYFKNASFEEVITTLERWYGVNIEVKRQDIKDGFSGTYTNRSLKSVLNGIGFVQHFDYEIKGNKVIIQ
jgi:transmembrane sensor